MKEAILVLPSHFRTETVIAGIRATDLFTLGAALGATIEEQVVSTLNGARAVWDPQGVYDACVFIRRPQTFPDVQLVNQSTGQVLMGLELKSWYLLAKEGEPSFRFKVTPAACAPQDLIVIVPWALSNVIAGAPKVFPPYVESARYAAEYRNYHWGQVRESDSDRSIVSPPDAAPYPAKSDAISDRPAEDAGGNFGRFARTGLMDAYLLEAGDWELCGIPAQHWRAFFRAFQDRGASEAVRADIQRLAKRVEARGPSLDTATLERARRLLADLEALILREPNS